MTQSDSILWFEHITMDDIGQVGGKNASLGEMTHSLHSAGVPVPPGFAITAQVYRDFIEANALAGPIAEQLAAREQQQQSLAETGAAIRELILAGEFTSEQRNAIEAAYEQLCERLSQTDCPVAVRSSATAEDLPEASFAGQQESFLNVRGLEALLETSRACLASLYTDRAIAYREQNGFAHEQVALSIGVQQMVRSDVGCAGVLFTLDTESGFPDVILINGAWGLGESVVKGSVNPDRYMVYKPLLEKGFQPIVERTCGSKAEKMLYAEPNSGTGKSTRVEPTTEAERNRLVLNDEDILTLARWAQLIEQHYRRAMDIEWARDGETGQLYIVQARPETIESQKDRAVFSSYTLKEKGRVLVEGASVGSAIAAGTVCKLDRHDQSEQFPEGGILVTDRTDPDWVPIMRRAAGVITNSGGATSHAAIVSRELKVPAIVGAGNATECLAEGSEVTLDCSKGAQGKVYEGKLPFDVQQIRVDHVAPTRTDLMINVAMPDGALYWWQLPTRGIGLARIEFIISSQIGVHPMALLHPERVSQQKTLDAMDALSNRYPNPAEFFVDQLATGIGKIAASCYPHPAVVRFSDLKSNEYRGLLGGEDFELEEDNPMLGLRGASRYYHEGYREAFQLECQALKRARELMGFDNIIAMIPFCRTPAEADKVLEVMAEADLKRGKNGLQVYVMCEIPSNVILAEQFAERFDGFSIGSNDLTQLVLGIDRDSQALRPLFDARDEAVKRLVSQVIRVAHEYGRKVGICGQAPSDHPDFAEFLVECGIDSISLNPDSIIRASEHIAQAEAK
ncbi:phosphoenolpyruvate synthase [Marinimicrobium locisalis]|uniref:phosphoenolpyruvate synthase n=1 Tax=Marinimicrobium locisalis TaxID=546022 RepID=UPI0032218A1E